MFSQRGPRRRLLAALTVIPLAAGVSGCSKSISEREVEQQVSSALQRQVGKAPDSVSCPGKLKAEVNETMRCTITAERKTYGLTVTVTSVKGGKAQFKVQVDDKPQG